MERFHGHIGALQRALQEAPEVLAAVRVNLPVYVRLGVVNDVVNVALVSQTEIRAQRIGRVSGISCVGHSMRSAYAPQTEKPDA